MKSLSRRMKRMLAILLVETIVAVNVISSYASDADGIMTFSEEEVSEMAENASSTSEGGSSDSEPAAEESSYEEPAYEEPVEETPQEEEPQTEEPQETPAEQEESGTDDPVAEEPSLTNEDAASEETVEETPEEQQSEEAAEEASECTCEKSCGASEYDAGCPVCRAAADMDESEREAFLKDHCSKYEEVTEEEKDDITEPEIINKESNITITGTSVADGAAIEGASDFTISVSGEVTLSDKAPAIEGYEFNGRIYLKESGSEISAVKKETVENKETEDDVVVKIIKETTVSVYDVEAADWKALEADTVVVFEYTALEDEEEDTDENSVQFYAACVDEDGNAIEGYEKQRLTVADALDLTKAPITIEGYEYVEATVDGTVVLSVEKSVAEDAEDEDGTVYSYTTSDGSVEVSEDTTVTLTYQAVEEAKEVVLSWNYVDEDGNAIEGVEGEPEFEDTLVLDDAEKAPVAVEGYEYVEASIDGTVLTSITKETEQTEEADAEPVVTYSYTTTSGESVAIEEDTEITLNYEETGIAVKVDATVVDEFGDEIDEKYTNMELPEFTDGVLVLDDVENPPVAKVQVRKSLFKVVKYTYVQATIDGKIVTGLKREATKETADLAEKEQEFIYSYSTDGASWTKLTEDTTVIFEYTDGKKTVFTYEDSKVQVTATLQHAGAVPDDAELVVTEITSGQAYDAYMEALNASDADKEYSEQNTLLYDIGFVATDEETGETVEVEPTEGSVKISIVFKQNQLSEDLSAAASEEVEIKHLPLADGVKESAGTTLDAENISASDVKVESVSNQVVNVDSGVAEFVTDSFSVYSVSSKPAIDVEKIDMDIMGILSAHGALGYGIVANSYSQSDSDTETNLMVGSYRGSAYMGASSTYSNAGGNNYFGSVVSGVKTIPFHLPPANIYLGTKATEQYEKGDFGFNDSEIRGTVIHKNHEINVANIVAGVGEDVNNAVSENNASNLGNAGNDEYLLDLRSCSAGTYVVNYSGTATINEQLFDIYLNSNQRLVINCTAESVCLQRYHLNGQQPSYYIHNGAIDKDWVTQAVVFNCPNATSVDIKESMGIIIAPKANVKSCEGANAGILICNTITGYNEWHYHNHDLPAPGDAELSLEITKMYNQPLTAEQFSFTLKDDEGNVVGTAKNDANGKVKFEKISYSAAGTYYYTITEDIPEGAVSNTDGTKTYDNVIYENSVITAAVTVELNTALNKYTVTSISYTKADGNGQPVTEGTGMIRNEEIETIEISGTKTWNDNNNQDGMRPASITINLLADGTKVKEQTVRADGNGNWSYHFTDLPKSANGQDIVYTITEEAVKGYTSTVDGYNVTNSHNPGTVDIFGEKVWDDSNDQDGSRPDSVTIKLWVNDKETDKTTVATIDNNWKWSFDNLPEYANGQKITYTVTEEAVDGYEFVGITEDKEKGFVITNKHTPETVDISGEKVWNDNDNQDGARPDSITIRLWADGKDTGKTTTTTAGQEWKWSFTDLAKYKNVNGKGVEIQYTVTEDAVEGYTTSSITKDAEKGFVITNTHTPEKTEISVTKKWDDNDDQDGVRPDSIDVRLYYTDGDKEEDVETVTLNADNNWTYKWTNLNKYMRGTLVEYAVSEKTDKETAENYTSVKVEQTSNEKQISFVITNGHTPGETSRTVKKVWDDKNNQDGLRPTSVEVQLYADDKAYGDPVILNNSNGWTYTWDNLALKAGGKTIKYTVVEEAIVDEAEKPIYTPEYTYDKETCKFTITNTHAPATVYVSGEKTWNDEKNQDGIRPESITVKVLADIGENGSDIVVASKTVSADDNWSWTFDNLPKYKNGKQIQYRISEEAVGGYTFGADYSNGKFNLINTHTPETTKVSGKKTWNDEDNQDGIRPASITVKLLANTGENGSNIVVASKTVSADDNWRWTFDNLPKCAKGKAITYTVDEVAVDGYTTTCDGMNVTNTHEPAEIKIKVTKSWNDAENQDDKRPDSIRVNLYKVIDDKDDPVTFADVALKDGEWTYSFTGLPKYENGNLIQYKITEEAVADYSTDITALKMTEEKNEYTCTITNIHKPDTIEISGNKVWDDNTNKYLSRPKSITVILLANTGENGAEVEVDSRTVSSSDNWSWKFDNLPKYKGGELIQYKITEETVTDYSSDITTLTMTKESNSYNCSITNTYTPGKTSIKVTKSWNDADNQDGKRPLSIEVQLLANGESAEKIGVEHATVTLNKDNNWSHTWNDLPVKYNKANITYSVKELTVIDGYNAPACGQDGNNFTITNTHEPDTIKISGNKIWDDADNQDGKRPETITVSLYKVNGDNERAFVESTTVRASEDWTYSFTDLPKYEAGKEIKYEVSEQVPDGYTASVDALYNITNKYTPETITINGTKTWENDDENKYSSRPESITVILLANTGENGAKVEVDSRTVSSSDNWSWKFDNLPKYKGGELIQYEITEETVTDYSSDITTLTMTKESNSYNCSITNTYTPGKTSIKVTKSWNDADNQDGKRPLSIEVQLLANGESAEKIGVEHATVTLNEGNNWSCTWKDLPVKYNKRNVTYTVKELTKIDGYATEITGSAASGYTITNTHTPEKVHVSGKKTWNDADNQDGIRPTSITVLLMARVGENGLTEEFDSKVIEPDEDGKWSWTFDDLPKYEKGEKIYYSISEKAVAGYEFAPDYTDKNFNLINTHEPAEIKITVKKSWNDAENQDGKRPDSIKVVLWADTGENGTEVEVKSQTVSSSNNWSWTFDGLAKYKNGGKLIQYRVSEEKVAGYDMDITTMTMSEEINDYNCTITNTYTPATTSISITKEWDDDSNRDGKRPDSITVNLYKGEGTEKTFVDSAEITVSTDNKWTHTFTDLPKYENGGVEIKYTVEEEVSGYTTTITGSAAGGYTITNTHTPETISISGTKKWDDEGHEGSRPDSITVILSANTGENGKAIVVDRKTVSADNNWSWTFNNLPKYAKGQQGKEIKYTIAEEAVTDYTAAYDGYNITNSYTPDKTSRTVEKVWDDEKNQDGLRPLSIEVQLFADGKEYGAPVILDASNSWKHEWKDLPIRNNRKDVVYTVKELTEIEGYAPDYSYIEDRMTITNSHTPETISIYGTKTWDDAENQDNARPQEIKINLLVNGTIIKTAVASANTNNWSWSFTNLPKYENGKLIPYTISEEAIDGYSPTITDLTMTKESNEYTCTITNTHTPETIIISGTKKWDDEGHEGSRPDSITVILSANTGENGAAVEVDRKTVSADDNWSWTFNNLPKYAQGKEIKYTIAEEAVTDYTAAYDGYNITNSYTPDKTSRTVEKVWDDEKNQDGLRPLSIEVQLFADGKEYGDPVTLNESNSWKHEWKDLPIRNNRKDVVYTVKELTEIEGYAPDYSYIEDRMTITNTHDPAMVYVYGEKTWDDGDDQDGKRPSSITVVLLADGVEVDRKTVSANDSGKWEWTFGDLPKYAKGKQGKQIRYSIKEIAVDGYTSTTDYEDGFFNLVNTHTPETVELSGSKTWNDANDQDGVRPSSITVHLLADGVEVDSRTVTAADNWSWTFKDLPKNKNVDGVVSPIEYKITEDAVDGYTASYTDDGTGLINSYTPEKTGRNVVKIWDDANNADQIRPAYIEVQLYADGEAYGDAVVLNDANGWSHAWTDLQAKKGGQYIVYTVQEITNVSGYTTTVTESGTTFTIVNYHPVTPPPTPTPPTTPPSTPPEETPTPTTPNITPTPNTPTPTPDDNEVLGARRGGAVLGARRGLDQAVLGKRRRPTTGDSAALIIWMITLFGAMGAATVSVIGLRKKEEEK